MNRPSVRTLAIGGGVLVLAGGALAAALGGEDAAPAPPPPPAVTVATVAATDVAPRVEFAGRTEPVETVEIRARVQGYLTQVNFRDGQDVAAGTVLYGIEPDAYAAQVAVARAQLQRAQALQLQASQSLGRAVELVADNAISRAEVDQRRAERTAAVADVALARANLRTAGINLGYTRVLAPIAGRLGGTSVTRGNVVGPETVAPLVRLTRLDPIRVVFSINERDLIDSKRAAPGGEQAALNAQWTPRLRLPDGSLYPVAGRVEYVDNQADRTTGTIAVRALFPNPRAALLPGQTLTVITTRADAERLPVVPLGAVQEDQQGRYVYVLGPGSTAVRRGIVTGQQEGQTWAVTRGLRPGERIVVEGLQKVRAGAPVRPVPRRSPTRTPARPG